MRKITILIFNLLLILSCFMLTSCGGCNHKNKTLVSDTSTCTKAGVITYKCDDCGKEFKEDSLSALGHDFSKRKSSDDLNCSVTYECTRCSETKVETKTSHEDDGTGNCKHCYGNSREITKKLCETKGVYNSSYKVYELKYTGTNYWTKFQYDKENDLLFMIVYEKNNGVLAINLYRPVEFQWYYMPLNTDFYYSSIKSNTIYVAGTRKYSDVKYSTRLSRISYTNYYGLTSSLLSSSLIAANELTSLACMSGTLLLFDNNKLMNIEFLGFVNWEK